MLIKKQEEKGEIVEGRTISNTKNPMQITIKPSIQDYLP